MSAKMNNNPLDETYWYYLLKKDTLHKMFLEICVDKKIYDYLAPKQKSEFKGYKLFSGKIQSNEIMIRKQKSKNRPAFDTTSANGKFIIQIFGAVAEFERNLISERTKTGIEGARRRKKLIGRPKGIKKETLEKYHFAFHLYENKNIPIDKACKQAGISKTSFYRVEKTLKKEKQNFAF